MDGNFTTVGETIARFNLNKGEQTAQAHAKAWFRKLSRLLYYPGLYVMDDFWFARHPGVAAIRFSQPQLHTSDLLSDGCQ